MESLGRFELESGARRLSVEVPDRFVMVEGEAVGRAVLGQDVHDVLLLTGRELVVAAIVAVIGSAAAAEVVLYPLAGLSPMIVRHIIINMREAPRLLRQPGFIVALALAALPGIWIDGRTAKPVGRLQQVGLIVQACVAKLTFFVETQCVSVRNIFGF